MQFVGCEDIDGIGFVALKHGEGKCTKRRRSPARYGWRLIPGPIPLG